MHAVRAGKDFRPLCLLWKTGKTYGLLGKSILKKKKESCKAGFFFIKI
jgi:hypothetical protein